MTEKELIEFFKVAIENNHPGPILETRHFEKNFFLVKSGDDILEVTIVGNIDPGAWEHL